MSYKNADSSCKLANPQRFLFFRFFQSMFSLFQYYPQSFSQWPLWFVVSLKSLFPKNSFKAFVEGFVGKVEILRAVYFHAIGGADGPYFCCMDDVVF